MFIFFISFILISPSSLLVSLSSSHLKFLSSSHLSQALTSLKLSSSLSPSHLMLTISQALASNPPTDPSPKSPSGFIVNRRSKLWVSSSKLPLPSLSWFLWVFPSIQALVFFFSYYGLLVVVTMVVAMAEEIDWRFGFFFFSPTVDWWWGWWCGGCGCD